MQDDTTPSLFSVTYLFSPFPPFWFVCFFCRYTYLLMCVCVCVNSSTIHFLLYVIFPHWMLEHFFPVNAVELFCRFYSPPLQNEHFFYIFSTSAPCLFLFFFSFSSRIWQLKWSFFTNAFVRVAIFGIFLSLLKCLVIWRMIFWRRWCALIFFPRWICQCFLPCMKYKIRNGFKTHLWSFLSHHSRFKNVNNNKK